jgi:hypothetical protein
MVKENVKKTTPNFDIFRHLTNDYYKNKVICSGIQSAKKKKRLTVNDSLVYIIRIRSFKT